MKEHLGFVVDGEIIYTREGVKMTLKDGKGSKMLLSQKYGNPGWKVWVDGKPVRMDQVVWCNNEVVGWRED
jgi:hypothetical protein